MDKFISKKSSKILGVCSVFLGLLLKVFVERLLVPDGSLDAGTVFNIIFVLRLVLILSGLVFIFKTPPVKKDMMQSLVAMAIGCGVAFVILEIFLRVFNPLGFRVKGDKIILPANMEYNISGVGIDKLDAEIIHKKNSLGFRGEEPPKNFDDYLTMVVVGASTAECFYLSFTTELITSSSATPHPNVLELPKNKILLRWVSDKSGSGPLKPKRFKRISMFCNLAFVREICSCPNS